jgi:hypothetical protein
MWKLFAIGSWVTIVFGYLFLLSRAYDANKSFVLFLFLAFGGNMAYDVTKNLVRLFPLYSSDWKNLCLKGFKFVGLFLLSFIGIAIDIFGCLPLHLGLAIWFVFYIWAMNKLMEMERYYGLLRNKSLA